MTGMAGAGEGTGGRPYVVLSPHLDDAVIGAWHALRSPGEVRVVTVFAGSPATGFVSALDRLGGATDSAARVVRRRADDVAALALAGREAVHLDLLDVQYRAHAVPDLRDAVARDPGRFLAVVAADDRVRADPDELRSAVEPYLAGGPVLYAPAGIGGHVDHVAVARLATALATAGYDVRLYADYPYCLRHGRPGWLGGAPNPDADAYVDEELDRSVPGASRFERHTVRLPDGEAVAKLAAVKRYETEFGPANEEFGGRLDHPDAMRVEAYWVVPRAPIAAR